MKGKSFFSILLLGVLVLGKKEMVAETRIYRYRGPIQKFIPEFVDKLGNTGLRFQITKQYNENTDGRLGFVLLVLPGRRIVDLQFIDENHKTTLVKIFYENPWDGKIFHQIFMKLSMIEPNTRPIDDSLPPGWPSPN